MADPTCPACAGAGTAPNGQRCPQCDPAWLRAEVAFLSKTLQEIENRREPLTADARTDGAEPHFVLAELLACVRCWEPAARILGNVRAADIERAILAYDERLARLEARLARAEERLSWHDPRRRVVADVGAFEVPLETRSEVNDHGKWRHQHRRAQTQHVVIDALLRTKIGQRPPPAAGYTIRLTRIARTAMDSDNAATATKFCRDSVARWLGIDDGDRRLLWYQGQLRDPKTREQRVRVEIATRLSLEDDPLEAMTP